MKRRNALTIGLVLLNLPLTAHAMPRQGGSSGGGSSNSLSQSKTSSVHASVDDALNGLGGKDDEKQDEKEDDSQNRSSRLNKKRDGEFDHLDGISYDEQAVKFVKKYGINIKNKKKLAADIVKYKLGGLTFSGEYTIAEAKKTKFCEYLELDLSKEPTGKKITTARLMTLAVQQRGAVCLEDFHEGMAGATRQRGVNDANDRHREHQAAKFQEDVKMMGLNKKAEEDMVKLKHKNLMEALNFFKIEDEKKAVKVAGGVVFTVATLYVLKKVVDRAFVQSKPSIVTKTNIRSGLWHYLPTFVKREKVPTLFYSPAFQDKLQAFEDEYRKAVKSKGLITLPNALFYGEPGVGKSAEIERLAQRCGAYYIKVSGSKLMAFEKDADAMRALLDVFEMAKRCGKPCIIFMDEADECLPVRDIKGLASKITTAWLEQFPEAGNHQVAFVIATNLPNEIDPSVLSRVYKSHIIKFEAPEYEEALRILEYHLGIECQRLKLSAVFQNEILDIQEDKLAGFTGRDLQALARQVTKHVYFSGKKQVTVEDIRDQLKNE